MSTPTAVEVRFPASGHFGTPDFWGERPEADRVEWRVSDVGEGKIIVSVTAFTATHRNHSWYDSRFFVADGLDSSEPPSWVPAAPAWFWAAVESMTATALATA